jgi:hypothetical protein
MEVDRLIDGKEDALMAIPKLVYCPEPLLIYLLHAAVVLEVELLEINLVLSFGVF